VISKKKKEEPGKVWKVSADEAGIALDKFLGTAERLTSRSKAAAARERGKVFVNDAEAGRAQAGLRLSLFLNAFGFGFFLTGDILNRRFRLL